MWWLAVAGVVLVGCGRDASDLDACLAAEKARDPTNEHRCEAAWQTTFDERAAGAGAHLTLIANDERGMFRWVARAANDSEGARVLHFLGALQVNHGDEKGAEASFRRALALRIDREPLRAANTASTLFDLVRNRAPAEESIQLLRVAWHQASLAADPLGRAMAASGLIEVLLDLGEIRTAELLVKAIDGQSAPRIRDLADGRVQAARGRVALAASLLARATEAVVGENRSWPDDGTLDAIDAYIGANQINKARALLNDGVNVGNKHTSPSTVETECLVATARARVELAEDNPRAALETVTRGLAVACPDRARASLLEVEGAVLDRLGDGEDGERAWQAAANSIESWRVSLPSAHLRTGLIAHHRQALEHWLDAAASRGDTRTSLAVAQRMLARELLDRMLDRESAATTSPEALIDSLLSRIADARVIEKHVSGHGELGDISTDVSIFLEGAKSIWLLRHQAGTWSIDSIGDREAFQKLLDEYRHDPDSRDAAARLGASMFGRVVETGAPLLVLLDGDMADVALAGLRVNGHYLVEYAPIVEILAPELLFEEPGPSAWQTAVVIGDPGGDLHGAAHEAALVGLALGVAPHVEQAATRAELIAHRTPTVLHLATHSSVVNGHALLSLADGSISTHDILDAKLAPRLAVVASCRSDGGDDPMTSLVATFLATGTQGVVGAKRAIDDQGAAAVFADFYAAGGDTHPIEALATAQRRAIASKVPPHIWASVSFFGTSRRKDQAQ